MLSMEAFVADAAWSGDVHPLVYGIEEKRDRLLDEVDCYKMEEGEFPKILLEEGVAMKAMKTSLLDLEKSVASLETEKTLY